MSHNVAGQLPSMGYNEVIQRVKKLLARLLAWHTRPLHDFNASISGSLEELGRAAGHQTAVMLALDDRLALAETRSATLAESIQGQVGLLHEHVDALASREVSRFYIDTGLRDRTAYIVGLFGTGRLYVSELVLQNIGERARYFRDGLRFHRGPTSMIYSGHATMRHLSRSQAPPVVMNRVLDAVRSRCADLIFVYRHPLDSLLTNWIWWRTWLRDNTRVTGISQVYENTEALCAVLEQNFSEFKAFAEGEPDFFAGVPGTRFLLFSEFVAETELHLRSPTLTLRLEDCVLDPGKEFSKIADVLAVDLDVSRLRIAPPRTTPYRHLAVREHVPRFRHFIDGLDTETKRRIERMGYPAV